MREAIDYSHHHKIERPPPQDIMLPRTLNSNLFCLMALLLQSYSQNTDAFQVSLPTLKARHESKESLPPLHMGSNPGGGFGAPKKSRNNSPSTPAGDFAFQEMLVYFNAMQKEGATSRTMDPTKRSELEGFVRTVLANKNGLRIQDIGQAILPKSDWRLMFSTSEAVLESLPNDATVFLNIVDEENLDYILKFSKKTMGLDSLTAKCKYTFDAGPVQPGLLSFTYEKIATNILGLSNVGVGFFGMLKGRVNYVESAYFDGTFWIERGVSPTGNGDFINVYMRMDA